MLERVRARDEVDRLGLEAGCPRVARREVVDPERPEVGGTGDPSLARVAHGPAGFVLELAVETVQPFEGEVDELRSEVRPNVDERLALDPERPVRELDPDSNTNAGSSQNVPCRYRLMPNGRPILSDSNIVGFRFTKGPGRAAGNSPVTAPALSRVFAPC